MYYRSIVNFARNFNINPVVKILILSDFLILSSAQFLTPIFALFITSKIAGGNIETVGIAAALLLLSRSVMEIPVGIIIDRTPTENDDLYSIIIGSLISAMVYFSYVFASEIWQVYILQVMLGLAAAIAHPGWYSIFTKHADKGREAFEWSLYEVILGLGMALSAALGGYFAYIFGFEIVFLMVGIGVLFSVLTLLFARKKILKYEKS